MDITFDSKGAYIAIHYGGVYNAIDFGETDIAIGQGCTILSTIATPMTPSDVATQYTSYIISLDLGISASACGNEKQGLGGSITMCLLSSHPTLWGCTE
jgi:hypothetical protein